MDSFIVLVLITAYSFCVINIIIGIFFYQKRRDKAVLAYLFILANLLLSTVFIMLNHVFGLFNVFFFLILFNILSLYYITIPYFILQCVGINIDVKKLVSTVLISLVVIDILFIIVNPEMVKLMFYFYGLPFIILFIYIYYKLKKQGKIKEKIKKSAAPLMFWKSIDNCGVITGVIAFLFWGVYQFMIPFSLKNNYIFTNYYFALFTVIYNIPGMIFFLSQWHSSPERTSAGDLQSGMGKLGLSTREQEVAVKLINGMKYEEIAKTLFISLSTVKKHAYNIYRKAEVTNSRQLMQKIINFNGSN